MMRIIRMADSINEIMRKTDEIIAEGKISVDKEQDTFFVETQSKDTFEVHKTPDGWHCSCEPYKDRGTCQHILAVNIASQGGQIKEKRSSRRIGRPRRRPERGTYRRRYSGTGSRQRRDWKRGTSNRGRTERSRRH